jgi:uncharacterized membrane protein
MDAIFSATVLGLSVYLMLWLFLVYSFAGVLIEGFFCLLVNGVLELRLGLLYLPLRPLYGFGGVACTLFLHRLLHEPILVFLLGMLICTVVEFVDSWVTEKAFGALSWDYSDKLLNVQGRVCLQYSFCWGVLALVAVYALDRVRPGLAVPAGGRLGETVLTVLLVLVVLSVVLTLAALVRVRDRVDVLRAQAAGATATAPARTWGRLVDRLVPDPVIIASFPRMSLVRELEDLTAGRPRTEVRPDNGHDGAIALRAQKPHSL